MTEPLTTTTARVRAVAVGNQITLPATEAAFVAELECIVSLGAQYLSPNQPNVLVLGEMLGLPAAFTGQRALLARHAATARTAMAEIAAGLLPRMIRCRQIWPGSRRHARCCWPPATRSIARFVETLSRLAANIEPPSSRGRSRQRCAVDGRARDPPLGQGWRGLRLHPYRAGGLQHGAGLRARWRAAGAGEQGLPDGE